MRWLGGGGCGSVTLGIRDRVGFALESLRCRELFKAKCFADRHLQVIRERGLDNWLYTCQRIFERWS